MLQIRTSWPVLSENSLTYTCRGCRLNAELQLSMEFSSCTLEASSTLSPDSWPTAALQMFTPDAAARSEEAGCCLSDGVQRCCELTISGQKSEKLLPLVCGQVTSQRSSSHAFATCFERDFQINEIGALSSAQRSSTTVDRWLSGNRSRMTVRPQCPQCSNRPVIGL